jgi:hypothetical protein
VTRFAAGIGAAMAAQAEVKLPPVINIHMVCSATYLYRSWAPLRPARTQLCRNSMLSPRRFGDLSHALETRGHISPRLGKNKSRFSKVWKTGRVAAAL